MERRKSKTVQILRDLEADGRDGYRQESRRIGRLTGDRSAG